MTQPYLSLCMIVRNNEGTLPKLLDSVQNHFDEFCFVDTGSTDGTKALLKAFLKERPGKLLDFEWVDDFAKARQVSFDAATGRWRMFLDSDDVLVGGEKIRPLLRKLEVEAPHVEAFFIRYDYDHLETLVTMRLVRWRDGWKWNDAIHERLEFTYPDGGGLPEEAFGRTEEFSVRHKPKNDEEKQAAILRNAAIARREYASTSDPKYRARLGRTLAMEAKMLLDARKAIPYLEELYRFYRTYPEGRQGAADISKSYLHLSDQAEESAKVPFLDSALVWASRAGPAYEAIVHHARGEYLQCLKAAQRSLGRGQQTTHEGLIFEQGAAYVAAAASALQLGESCPGVGNGIDARDVAERLLSHVPPYLRNDKSIGDHVAAIRESIDRITIVVPGTPQPFDENGGGGMLGGSEEAVLYLTREMAKSGRRVRIYTVLPPHRVPGYDRHGIDWRSVAELDFESELGTLVVWRAPQVFLDLMNRAHRGEINPAGISLSYLWLHDSSLGITPQVASALSQNITGAIVLSDFHAKKIQQAGWKGKLFKIANGIVEEDFLEEIDEARFGFKCVSDACPQCNGPGDIYPDGCGNTNFRGPPQKFRDPLSVVYSSCPSRGLVALLEMWPAIREAVPGAHLDIYYDWSMLERMQPALFDRVREKYEAVQHLDVTHHGGVSHADLHEALRTANVWAYSHFESPDVETFCISAVKALAAGATVLSVPNGALEEVTGGDAMLVKSVEQYREALIQKLKEPDPVEVRRRKAIRAVKRYGWEPVSEAFSRVWSVKGKKRAGAA